MPLVYHGDVRLSIGNIQSRERTLMRELGFGITAIAELARLVQMQNAFLRGRIV